MNRSETPQGLIKMLFGFTPDRQFFASIRGWATIFALVFFGGPAHITDHLLHTGRGIAAYRIIPFVLVSAGLFWISVLLQSTAGDAVFLLWAVFTFKWVAEFVWAILRRHAGSFEHSYHPGVPVLSVIGLRSITLSLILLLVLAQIVIAVAPVTMWAVGITFVLGSIGALVINAYVSTLQVYDERRRADVEYAAKVESRVFADQERVVYHDVRGE